MLFPVVFAKSDMAISQTSAKLIHLIEVHTSIVLGSKDCGQGDCRLYAAGGFLCGGIWHDENAIMQQPRYEILPLSNSYQLVPTPLRILAMLVLAHPATQ